MHQPDCCPRARVQLAGWQRQSAPPPCLFTTCLVKTHPPPHCGALSFDRRLITDARRSLRLDRGPVMAQTTASTSDRMDFFQYLHPVVSTYPSHGYHLQLTDDLSETQPVPRATRQVTTHLGGRPMTCPENRLMTRLTDRSTTHLTHRTAIHLKHRPRTSPDLCVRQLGRRTTLCIPIV